MTGSPWPILRDKQDIALIYTDDDDRLAGADARWFADTREIIVDSRLRYLIQRCSIAHELAHEAAGDTCTSGHEFFDNRMELAADCLAARWLLPDLHELATEIATTSTYGHAAANLRVTMDIFEARLTGLDHEEIRLLRKLVWSVHESAGA